MKTSNNILMTSNEVMSKEEANSIINHKGTTFYPNTKENRLMIKSSIDELLKKLRK